MRPMANGLAIPAGHTTILKPRGYHLLLLGVKAPLVKGSTLPVTLTFEKAGSSRRRVRGRGARPDRRGHPQRGASPRIAVPSAEGVLDQQRIGIVAEIARADRHLAVAARHVEHVGRLRAGPTAGRAAPSSRPGRARPRPGNGRCRAPGRDDAGSRASRARVTRARMSASRVSTSSLTPASSTVWPISGMPASASRASAARARGAELAGVIAVHGEPQRARAAASAPPPARRSRAPGSTIGTRLWMRITPTWSMASRAAISSASRRGDSISGSPPVRITSQISGRARM